MDGVIGAGWLRLQGVLGQVQPELMSCDKGVTRGRGSCHATMTREQAACQRNWSLVISRAADLSP